MKRTFRNPDTGAEQTVDYGDNDVSDINPKHYALEVKGHKFEVADLMEARFSSDAHLAQALKYLLRAGRKPESSYLKDVGKCLWWCAKAILFRGGKIELPENSGFMPLGVETHRKQKAIRKPGHK